MNIMLPTDSSFVEKIAIAIARDRLHRESIEILESMLGINVPEEILESEDENFDAVFEAAWNSNSEAAKYNKDSYIADAKAAVNRINLLLLTT